MNIQEFLKLAEERSSVRRYSNREVSRELISQILESARIAPSAVNFQPWKFLVVTSEKTKAIIQAKRSTARCSAVATTARPAYVRSP